MRRRDFITLLGGAATAWPVAARAQQPEGMRRIGVLLPASPDDSVFQARVETFVKELARLGWTIERNTQIDIRWASTNANEIRRHAAELAALSPDVILATGDSTMPPLLQATHTIPIVFPVGMDPVANGYIDSLARPGGNATGFMDFEYSVSGKWLEPPDLILANSTPVTTALREQSQVVPIVFTQVTDPVGEGLVPNLAHPGGNLTGFTSFEFSIGTKWLQALKQTAPRAELLAMAPV